MEVAIKRNSTGEVRTLSDLGPFDEFYFSEGNGACDCMRRAWFAEADGAVDYRDICGYDEFSIEITEGGEILYSEFSTP